MSTYDLSLYKNGQALQAIGPVGKAVTGPAKASQKFTSAFMTQTSTQTYKPEYGCDFITEYEQGNIRTDSDVTLYFNQAASDVLYYMDRQLTGDEPDDEVIIAASLDHFELDEPDLFLYIILTTKDGQQREIVLPVSSVEV